MAREYNLTGVDTKFALAYGILPVRGTLVNHETTAVGSDLQVKYRRALGIGEWQSCEKVFYIENDAAHEIDSANYAFHPGGASDTVDTFFPTSPTYPGYVYSAEQLPPGLSAENKPENAIGIYKCLKIQDYDSSGTPLGKSFSQNYARIILDVIGRIQPVLLNYIDYPAWVALRDWFDEEITVTIDGDTTTVPRFYGSLFLAPPFNLGEALDKICQICCTDWQWVNGKLVFLPPTERDIAFTFNLSNIGESLESFRYMPTARDSRPNMVRVTWRDAMHQYLKEAEPIEIRREDLITEDGGIENPLEINLGVVNKSQAQRVGEFWANVRCDNAKFAAITAGWSSYPVVTSDIVAVTHDIPDWTDKLFKVIEKEEDEASGNGYYFKLASYTSGAYSDDVHTVIPVPEVVDKPDPYLPPPPAVLTLALRSVTGSNQSSTVVCVGTVEFGDFGFAQFARVLYKSPLVDEFIEIGEVSPNSDNVATFTHFPLPSGVNIFKTVVYSVKGVNQTEVSTEYEITVPVYTFTIGETAILNGVLRSYTGFNSAGVYTGRDTGVVPVSKISAVVNLSTVKDAGMHCDFEITGTIIDRTDIATNADSISESEVAIFDKFGGNALKVDGSAAIFSSDYRGAGTLASGEIHRKYSDPREEAYYRIRIKNSFGWSAYKYLLSDGTLSNTPPTPKSLALAPKNLSASILSSGSIMFNAEFTFDSNTLTVQKRALGELFASWSNVQTGISALPVTITDLPSNTEFEYRLLSSTGTNNSSNIVRATTLQTSVAPTRLAPLGLTVVPNPGNLLSQLLVSWVRNATDNTDVEIDIDGAVSTLAAGTVTNTITGLAEDTPRTVRVRNKWSSGETYSAWTDYVTGRTNVTPPLNPPQSFTASYDLTNSEIDMSWVVGDGFGAYTVEISDTGATPQAASGASGWTNITSALSSAALAYSHAFARTSVERTRYVRIKRNDVTGWVVSGAVIIPASDPAPAYPPILLFSPYNLASNRFEIAWIPQGGSGNYTLEYRLNTSVGWDYDLAIDSGEESRNIGYSRPSASENWEFRIKRNDVLSGEDAWSNEITVFVEGTGEL